MTKKLSQALIDEITAALKRETTEDVAMMIEAMEFLYFDRPEIYDVLQSAKIVLEERIKRAKNSN